MARTLTLRLLGLAVAVVFAVAATALLSSGLGFEAGGLRSWLGWVADYIAGQINEGATALAGAAVGLVTLVTAFLIVRPSWKASKRLEKTREGVIDIDLSGLARVAQRKLRDEVDVGIVVGSRGRRGLTAIVPTYGGAEPLSSVNEAAVVLPALLEQLGAEVAYRVVTGDPSKSRVR